MMEQSLTHAVDNVPLKISSPKEENISENSDPATDPEDNEISDDEDDDRNHKHRRRGARPPSFDNNGQGHSLRRFNRKRNRQVENRSFSVADSHNEFPKEYPSKIEKRRVGTAPLSRAHSESVPRGRLNQTFHPDSAQLDLARPMVRPPGGRGRGRNMVPWTRHDARFNPLDIIDFASQMASQDLPAHPSLFAATGMPSGTSAQNGTWGAFGFIPGAVNRILDPINTLGLQGALQPAIAPLLDLGMPRQRCRDFEERGFCLRGDMCPMEHGVNRIVIEDMQSLSQFNLPVSIPNTHALGIQAETSSVLPGGASSSLLASSKAIPTKDNKPGMANDALKLNGVSSTSGVAEADVYDPDQPLWNNEQPETSCAGLKLPSPDNDEQVWNADAPPNQGHRPPDGTESEYPTANSSVWARLHAGNKMEEGKNNNTCLTSTNNAINETAGDHEEATLGSSKGKLAASGNIRRYNGRITQKASRTLYICGIPQNNNRIEALLSHFQKFGNVIDIYIPSNSEKAFVQFSKREEAEAALKAPDAVMGNRFIKLWWANRDRIPKEGEYRIYSKSIQLSNEAGSSVPSQPSVSERRKENLPSAAPRPSGGSAADAPLPSTGPPKGLMANVPKLAPPVQKKPESVELLEELRKKQEILAQKRDEFRRQLDKLEKQASSVIKGQTAGKGQMAGAASDIAKTATPRFPNQGAEGTRQAAGYTLESRNSEDCVVSPSSKASPASEQQSAKTMKQTALVSASVPSTLNANQCLTSFRILPPLPAGIANGSILKDHFSMFGDLSSVVLEDTGNNQESQTSSACVTYTTHQSAERAYIGGASCKGHNLRFLWLTLSPRSSNSCGPQGTSTPLMPSSTKTKGEQPTCGAVSKVAADGGGEPVMSLESANCAANRIPAAVVCDVALDADNRNADSTK